VLYPHGSQALPTLRRTLEEGGAYVHGQIVYETAPGEPSPAAVANFEAGVDAVLFASPSAVSQFQALGLSAGDATLACIGETTASEARAAGYRVDIVPAAPGTRGLLAALLAHVRRQRAGCRVA
jgi:uroporphyrinogen-III synthase